MLDFRSGMDIDDYMLPIFRFLNGSVYSGYPILVIQFSVLEGGGGK